MVGITRRKVIFIGTNPGIPSLIGLYKSLTIDA